MEMTTFRVYNTPTVSKMEIVHQKGNDDGLETAVQGS
jgi:hypothetical protein